MTSYSAIIFGASGQDGIYMADLCKSKGIEPICVARREGFGLCGSVGNYEFVKDLIQKHKPAYIFHFAANSTTRHEALFENHETISTGTLNILENVKLYSPASKVLITGSGLQFRNEGQPISENTPFEAGNAYAISRIQSVYAARYFRSLGVQTYVAYLFHHESPYRHDIHISKYIANTIKSILNGERIRLKIGDPSVQKEWGFAADIISGVFALINQNNAYEAAIGTGMPHSIHNYLEICFELAGLDIKQHVDYLNDFRSEYKLLVSDPATINRLGWIHQTDLKALARLMIGNI